MDGLLGGFSALMSPDLWALMLVGVVVGIIFGAIPGLSATMAIVLFLPITFSLNVYQAFTLLVALYIGGVSGGLISAIAHQLRLNGMDILFHALLAQADMPQLIVKNNHIRQQLFHRLGNNRDCILYRLPLLLDRSF